MGTRSGFSAKVEGLPQLRARLLALAGPEAEAAMGKVNQKNADEFEAGIRAIIPRGDPVGGNLVDSLRQWSPGGIAVAVGIGGPGHIYPLHLEAGHRMPNGTHVPGKPFWNPTKRAHNRAVRAERAAIKRIVGG